MATEHTGAVSTCVDSHGSAIGMPQLCFDWFPNQIFWLVITLVVVFLVLSRVALPRIAAILAERQGTITNDLAAAEDLKAKALAAEEAYTKALAEARAEAQRIAGEARAEIQAELNEAIAKADAEIAAKAAESEKAIAEIRAGALESIEAVAKDTAGELVNVLGGQADDATVAGAVEARMKG
ncbi:MULTISPECIES: F0F1 ATP synthase subunit B' [Ruegeria]|uniref:ATP synthase subunit b n=2 Tax=Ruegeria TaxID=97050 RepID=A0A6B2NMB4_9RHOB|nr:MULTISPECIES: F0F1 ATP synthase subunit B' [unclassified Ruegeria]MCU9838660.1 F0F1 ATP synthase subunit B' [Ruegeria sp. WL0004]NDW43759.1 F0F1 ATP synthase subunit B' [Ruegeria sp. PrR005]